MKLKLITATITTTIAVILCCCVIVKTQNVFSYFTNYNKETPPIYYSDDIDLLENNDAIESHYITDRLLPGNHFYIKDHTLWGLGQNQYWQLGIEKEIDRNNLSTCYTTPVKIAENVIHVDASCNGNFMIFLTTDHKLYGLGANTEGVLLQPVQEFEQNNYHKNITGTPVLLMENVLFASAGRESISALTESGDVWWWGKFQSTSATNKISKMQSTSPKLMISNARYTVCGIDFAAAIDQNNNLWTWGNNVFGQCGITPSVDYISDAIKVQEQINMVWPESLTSKQNTKAVHPPYDTNPYESIIYPYTLFIQKENGDYFACGINLGNDKKTVDIHGDIHISESDNEHYDFSYSSDFVEIRIIRLNESTVE